MLTRYIQAALEQATFEWLEDDQAHYGEIPGLRGVWATGETIEGCRTERQEVLEDWLALGLARRDHIPVVNGIDVNVEPVR